MMEVDYKLGCLEPRESDPRQMLFRYSHEAQLPPLPVATSWRMAVKVWRMLLNNQYGDCVPAGMLHAAQLMTALASTEYQPSDDDALKLYMAVGGFNPADPSTDRGCVMRDVADFMVKTGFMGIKLDACPEIDYRDLDHVRMGIHLLSALPAGVLLPRSAKSQFMLNEPWDLTLFPSPIVGGHCILFVDYDGEFFYVVTWGKVQKVTPRWAAKYLNQVYAPLSKKLWVPNGQAPNAIDIDQLIADQNQLLAA